MCRGLLFLGLGAVGCAEDRWGVLSNTCEQDWSLYGAPEKPCAQVIDDHFGIDAQNWDEEKLSRVRWAAWTVAFAPVELKGGSTQIEMYNTLARTKKTEWCDNSRFNRLTRKMCLHPNPGMEAMLSDFIHEGAHNAFTHGAGGYDYSFESPYGWAARFNWAMARMLREEGDPLGARAFMYTAKADSRFVK